MWPGVSQEVYAIAAVVELEHGGADGDAALAFQFHPVGSGGALVLAGGDRAGQLDGAAVEQELLGQSGFAGVGVRDDRKRAPAGNLVVWVRHGESGEGAWAGDSESIAKLVWFPAGAVDCAAGEAGTGVCRGLRWKRQATSPPAPGDSGANFHCKCVLETSI